MKRVSFFRLKSKFFFYSSATYKYIVHYDLLFKSFDLEGTSTFYTKYSNIIFLSDRKSSFMKTKIKCHEAKASHKQKILKN